MDQQQRKSTTHRERFFHMQFDHPKYRGATVFAREEGPGVWQSAIALCSVQDNFCRATGRTQARRHYFTGHKHHMQPEPYTGADLEQLVIDMLSR